MRIFPLINDVCTDTDDPVAFTAAPIGPLADEFKRAIARHYPDLVTLELAAPADEVFARARALAQGWSRWTITRVDAETRELEGVATTRLLRFRDDFAIRVRPRGDGSAVDMRSRSRLGKGDLGANAERIHGFFAALRDAMGQRR